MIRHWEIKKNQLRFYGEDGIETIPDASTVLQALHGETAEYPSPIEDNPELHFSSIAAEYFLQISFDENNNDIILSIGVRRGKSVLYPSLSLDELRDHIVFDYTWRYISNFEDLLPLLSDIGISSFGKITLQQYLNIKQIISVDKYPTLPVEDQAADFIDNHPLSVNEDEAKVLVSASLYPYEV